MGDDAPLTPARRAQIERIGAACGYIMAVCGELPDGRLPAVARTLEHAVEVLADEAGVRHRMNTTTGDG